MKPLQLLGLAALLACGRPSKDTKTPPPEVTLYQVKMTTWQGSRIASHGTAKEIVYQRSTGDAQAQGAVVALPSSGQAERFTLFAPVLQGNLPRRQAEGAGGVVLRGDRGLVGRTARAHYDGRRALATGHDRVTLTGTGYSLEAGGFSFALRPEDLTFTRPVKSAFGGGK